MQPSSLQLVLAHPIGLPSAAARNGFAIENRDGPPQFFSRGQMHKVSLPMPSSMCWPPQQIADIGSISDKRALSSKPLGGTFVRDALGVSLTNMPCGDRGVSLRALDKSRLPRVSLANFFGFLMWPSASARFCRWSTITKPTKTWSTQVIAEVPFFVPG